MDPKYQVCSGNNLKPKLEPRSKEECLDILLSLSETKPYIFMSRYTSMHTCIQIIW